MEITKQQIADAKRTMEEIQKLPEEAQKMILYMMQGAVAAFEAQAAQKEGAQ